MATGNAATEKYRSVRVYDPSSAPTHTVKWGTANVGEKSGIVPQVNIYMDTDNSGFDGTFIGRTAYTANQYSFPTAALPPGEYFFYVVLKDNENSDGTLATSGYSSKLTVNAKTRLTFQNPSYTSGPDYATDQGNPWDFDASADVGTQANISAGSVADGKFSGTSSSNDPSFFLNPQSGIDTSKYRYLTYQVQVDGSAHPTIGEKLANGHSLEVVYADTDFGTNGTITKRNLLFEGLNTHSFDLSASGINPTSGLAQTGWTGNSTNNFMRIDPVTGNALQFDVLDVKLTGDPESSNGTFIVQFTTTDLEGESATVEFFRDSDASGYDGVSLGSQSFPVGQNTFNVNTSALAEGLYHIYAVVTDAEANVFKFYADVPMKVVPAAAPTFAITVTQSTGGSISPDTTSVTSGGTQEFTITPADEYIIASITADGQSVTLPSDLTAATTYTFSNVTATHTLTATFTKVNRIPRYRLYNPNDPKHHFTTNLNEYNVLDSLGWNAEGIAYYVYDQQVRIGGEASTKFFRLYNSFEGRHLWTTIEHEYNVLGGLGWNQEGFDSWIFLNQVSGSTALYRLYNSFEGKHLWSIDLNERNVLISLGWNDEGITGYVFQNSSSGDEAATVLSMLESSDSAGSSDDQALSSGGSADSSDDSDVSLWLTADALTVTAETSAGTHTLIYSHTATEARSLKAATVLPWSNDPDFMADLAKHLAAGTEVYSYEVK